MISQKQHILFFCLIIGLAAALRLPRLDDRPMHTDEAVHAVKFGNLLENNQYEYDPFEYHGPTLNYATLVLAKLKKINTFENTNETLLRLTPVLFGFLLFFFLPALSSGLSPTERLCISALTALSPALVFYSRYYIQEILFIAFTFAAIVCAYNGYLHKRWVDARLTGLFLGLMHATKETAVIAYAAMAAGLAALWMTQPDFKHKFKALPKSKGLAMLAAAAGTSMLFYSSFLSHPQGILDSWRTYSTYFNRASAPAGHLHPWYTYFMILFKTEGGFFIIGLTGLLFALKQLIQRRLSGLMTFWTVYTLILTLVYTLLPYKTPWSMLGFWHGWIVLAAWFIHYLWKALRPLQARLIFITFLILSVSFSLYQNSRNMGAYAYAPSNPLTYSQPEKELLDAAKTLKQVAAAQPEGDSLYIEVISPALDYWPLPWYLRGFPNVSYWQHVNPETPPAPVILVHPNQEKRLIEKLYTKPAPGQRHLYMPLLDHDLSMRPGVILKAYIRKDYWDRYWEFSS